MSKIILSICIPTYNRISELKRQLTFLTTECRGIEGVEIIVRDNCSNISSTEMYLESMTSEKVHYYVNKVNLGLVGNLIKLSRDARGSYIWFVGDDDRLHRGIVTEIVSFLDQNRDTNFLMLNYRAIDKFDRVLMGSAFPETINFDLIDIFNHSGATMMAITACIYKKEILLEAMKEPPENRLCAPLFWSFYSSSLGYTKFLKKIYITCLWGESSWSAESQDVFNKLIPQEIDKFKSLNFPLKKIAMMKIKYLFWNIKRNIWHLGSKSIRALGLKN